MKYSLFNQGLFGDLVISTGASKIFKEKHPQSTLLLNVNKRYSDIISLFYNHPYIDGFKIWSGYDDWPDESDKVWIDNNKHKYIVGNAMPQHKDDWRLLRHQSTESAYMNNIIDLGEAEKLSMGIPCYLEKWFDVNLDFTDYVAISSYGGGYRGLDNEKCLSINKSQEIIKLLNSLGYNKILQIGDKSHPVLNGAVKPNTNFLDSIKNMLACKFLITVDTSISWISSAYQFPTVGLYSNQFYGDRISTIQPINKNAAYLSEDNVNNIPLERISDAIGNL